MLQKQLFFTTGQFLIKIGTLFIVCCMGITPLRAQSSKASLTGTWNIRQVELKQTVDGIAARRIFTSSENSSMQSVRQRLNRGKVSHTDGTITNFSIVRRPVRITFAGNNITLEYADGSETGSCRFEGDHIHVDFPTHPCEYTYSFAGDGELRLNYTVDYLINDDTKHTAKDECTFYGRK
ncbi:MAG: hypothetical protein LBJ39_02080 [Tannerellaceae bacterium]|jgi:hypothetical protein|nr:hypothetical protein [Tannerellaceae bacterium]